MACRKDILVAFLQFVAILLILDALGLYPLQLWLERHLDFVSVQVRMAILVVISHPPHPGAVARSEF